MFTSISILGIAPYEELNKSMSIISKQFKQINTDIFTADLEEGKQLATELSHHDYDVIISRGGTADLIRQYVSIPVIDVSISIYDILGTIRLAEGYTKNFAIVGYSSITETAHLLCDILGYNIKIITLSDTIVASDVLDTLVEESYEMILCDAVTNQVALTKSLNTILITSGTESIKHAFSEAIALSTYLKSFKHNNLLLEQSMNHQNQHFIILNEDFNIEFTNVSVELKYSIQKFLRMKKDLGNENQYYHTIRNKLYIIRTKKIVIDKLTYYSCTINPSTPPIINNKFGIFYQKRSEIVDIFTTQILSTKFIQENIHQELDKIKNYYNAIIIFGEIGTAKSSIAYQTYLNQEIHNNNLISINSKLLDDKMWKYLINPSNGPLVGENNTILFQNIEKLTLHDVERLIILVKNTKLLQRNNLIFTYNTNDVTDETIYNRLLSELRCATIYAPSLKERKNELNIITTLLLNKINIECNKKVLGFDPNALKIFLDFDWPGNLNQLQLALKELVINATSHYISEFQVSTLLNKENIMKKISTNSINLINFQNIKEKPTLFDYTKEIIENILEQNNGNHTKTATQLGISRTTLWRYLNKN